jgi:hypothetical protein
LEWTFRKGERKGTPRIVVDHGCWIWQGSTDRKGYGEVYFHRADFPRFLRCRKVWDKPEYRKARAHQLTYFIKNGNTPRGKELGHTCLRVSCCNWDHVRPVTFNQNYSDKFFPPKIPRVLLNEIELRLALDEPPRSIADDLGFSTWTLRTMAERVDYRKLLPVLMEKAAELNDDDGVPF